jgi:transcription antitermination factor NusG
MNAWHAARTNGGAEFAVTGAILAAGLDAYCPSYSVRRKSRYGHRGEFIDCIHALFPTYLFVRAGQNFRREQFETARIKIQLFRGGLVSQDVIDAVKATAAEVGNVATTVNRIEAGAFVKMMRGILRGDVAKVVKVKGQQAIIEVTRNGRTATFRTHVNELEAVG